MDVEWIIHFFCCVLLIRYLRDPVEVVTMDYGERAAAGRVIVLIIVAPRRRNAQRLAVSVQYWPLR